MAPRAAQEVAAAFCAAAGVEPRGTSRRLQRALVDFGAEESFARAAGRVREHYGVTVATGRLRRHTLAHGARLSARAPRRPRPQPNYWSRSWTAASSPSSSRAPWAAIAGRANTCTGAKPAREGDAVTARYGATLAA